MSKITRCRTCGGNIVEPAYPGDGAYPVPPMCRCNRREPFVVLDPVGDHWGPYRGGPPSAAAEAK